MEAAAVNSPATPAAVSQDLLPSTDPVISIVDSKNPPRQRQRTRRACYPCSKRKIKCDRDERTPCTNCAKRPNAELCTFDEGRPRSARPRHSATAGTASPTPGSLAGDDLSHERTPPQSLLRGLQTANSGIPLHGEERKVVLQHSDPPRSIAGLDSKSALLHHPAVGLHRHNGGIDAMQITPPPGPHHSVDGFNLHGASTHNGLQLSLPGLSALAALPLHSSTDELRQLLPPVKHVTKYCHTYHNDCHPLYPVDIGLPTVHELSFQYVNQSMGDRLIACFEDRKIEAFRSEVMRVALLCAGVAAGVQLSDLEDSTRRELLKQYVHKTMRLLRIADAQSQATLAAYPALLIVARVVQDEQEPILAYTTLGSASRIAQLYSINVMFPDQYGEDSRTLRSPDNLIRVRQRQESFLAILLGQTHQLERLPFPDTRGWTNATYLECLDVFAAVTSYCAHEGIDRAESLIQHATAIQEMQPLTHFALPHLADKSKCRNVTEAIEYSMLRIHECLVHIHYCQIIMAACRRLSGHEEEYFKTGSLCQTKALECIDTYIDMLGYSTMPLRSWILTVAALRSALIVGAMLAEKAHTVKDAEPQRDRLTRLYQAFTAVHDETQADRSRWVRRYSAVFQRLRDMCEKCGQPDVVPPPANGITPVSLEQGTMLQRMTREEKDEIMMPQRMVRCYFATPVLDENQFGPHPISEQVAFDI